MFPGHQGTSAVSYFVFLKFLFFLNIIIFLTTFICIVFFQVTFDTTDFSRETTGYDNSSQYPGLEQSETCTQEYIVNTTSGFSVFLDLLQGTVGVYIQL